MNDYRTIYPNNEYLDDFEYICFTDGKSQIPEPWISVNVYDVFPHVKNITNPKILSSYFKINTQKYFKENDIVVWWDCHLKILNNIVINSFQQIENGFVYNLHLNPDRITYTDEMIFLYHNGLITKDEVINKTNQLKSDNFIFANSICTLTANLSKRINKESINIDNIWWDKYQKFKCYAKRDQLPLSEALSEIKLDKINFYTRGLLNNLPYSTTKYSTNANPDYRPSWVEIAEMQSYLTSTTNVPLIAPLIMLKPLSV